MTPRAAPDEADRPDLPGRDEVAVGVFVERMALVFAHMGMPRMAARVLLTITSAEEEVLSTADLAARLGVSPAAVSGAVRYLMDFGFLVREPVAGSRRDWYRMPDDAWYEAAVLRNSRFSTLVATADQGIAALGGAETAAGRRVGQMRDFCAFADRELGLLMERWHARHTG